MGIAYLPSLAVWNTVRVRAVAMLRNVKKQLLCTVPMQLVHCNDS